LDRFAALAKATEGGLKRWGLKAGMGEKEESDGSTFSPARRRALIVEDEPMIALSLEADMREMGFETCDLAANGQQARSQAISNQPDVVLMDVNLEGGREGIEAAKLLREACDVPVVFVTGHTDRDTVERIPSSCTRSPGAAEASLERPPCRRRKGGHELPHVVKGSLTTRLKGELDGNLQLEPVRFIGQSPLPEFDYSQQPLPDNIRVLTVDA
jgi:CheY-like chemotaxis protein